MYDILKKLLNIESIPNFSIEFEKINFEITLNEKHLSKPLIQALFKTKSYDILKSPIEVKLNNIKLYL